MHQSKRVNNVGLCKLLQILRNFIPTPMDVNPLMCTVSGDHNRGYSSTPTSGVGLSEEPGNLPSFPLLSFAYKYRPL